MIKHCNINTISFAIIPWEQGVAGSNPVSPTINKGFAGGLANPFPFKIPDNSRRMLCPLKRPPVKLLYHRLPGLAPRTHNLNIVEHILCATFIQAPVSSGCAGRIYLYLTQARRWIGLKSYCRRWAGRCFRAGLWATLQEQARCRQ